ncbi:MAG: terpene cyclase/mutase family protein [Planctomycetes bacterium]|nr:terpene cyclase/mutase family protein [Planctomycetota bacterium]
MRMLLALLLVMAPAALIAGEVPRSVPLAIERGLTWLRGQQQGDGGLGGRHRTAVTGLATIAHLAAGVTPDLPEHGAAVRRMIGYILAQPDAKGYLGNDGSRMYGHAIACLAMADAIGTTRDDDLDERLRTALARALAVTVTAARVAKPDDQRGGWRYNPDEAGSDVSVTGWQLMSLHAARRIGMPVPDDVVEAALAYLRSRIDDQGRIGYTAPGEDRQAMRGLALIALSLQPGPRAPLRDRVLARMRDEPPAWTGPWFFYRAYYDASGLARSEPAFWAAYREKLHGLLVANQAPDGSWPAPPGDNERENGTAYAVAMAVLALTVDLRLLPGHQP